MLKSPSNKNGQARRVHFTSCAVHQTQNAWLSQRDAYAIESAELEGFLNLPGHGQKQALMATAHQVQAESGQLYAAGATYGSVFAHRQADDTVRYWTFNLGDIAVYLVVLDAQQQVVEAALLNPIHRVDAQLNDDEYRRISDENRSKMLRIQGASVSRALGYNAYDLVGLSHQPQMTSGPVEIEVGQRVFFVVTSNALKHEGQTAEQHSEAIGKLVADKVAARFSLQSVAKTLANHIEQGYSNAMTTVTVFEASDHLTSALVVSGHGGSEGVRIAQRIAEGFYPALQKHMASLQPKYALLWSRSREEDAVGVCQLKDTSNDGVTLSTQNWQAFASIGMTQRVQCLQKALPVSKKTDAGDAALCAAMVWLDAQQCVHLWLAHWRAEQNAYLIVRERHGDKAMVDVVDLYGSHPGVSPRHIQEERQKIAADHEALLFVTSHVMDQAEAVFKNVLYNHPHASPNVLALECCREAFRHPANRDLVITCLAVTQEPSSVLIANTVAQAKAEAFYLRLTQALGALSSASIATSTLFPAPASSALDSDQAMLQAKVAVWVEAVMDQYGATIIQSICTSTAPPVLLEPLHLGTENFYSCFGADTLDLPSCWSKLSEAVIQAMAVAIPDAARLNHFICQLQQHIESPTKGVSFSQNPHQVAKQALAQTLVSLQAIVSDCYQWSIHYERKPDNCFDWRISFEAPWLALNNAVMAYHVALSDNGSTKRKQALEGLAGVPVYELENLELTLDPHNITLVAMHIAAKLPRRYEPIVLRLMTGFSASIIGVEEEQIQSYK